MIPLTWIGIAFTSLSALLVLFLPRRWAAVPFMVCVCYMVLSQGIELGPFNFFVIRILVVVGVLRVILRGERPSALNAMDWLMVVWGGWAIAASSLHVQPSVSLVFNLGLAFNACGIYFLLRTFLTSFEDIIWLCRIVVLILIPVALEMIYEKMSGHNVFSILGGVPEIPAIRNGRLRAQGPFAHAILAGTVGAVCLPIAASLWGYYRRTAVLGILTCLAIIVSSASSGPLLSAIFAIMALALWPLRGRMRTLRWLFIVSYIALDLVMKAPAYYLLARIDLAGGSTGWHRAELINSAIRHLSEWWLAGTDYTRHWMPTGVSWSLNHTDITNHYIELGVLGGLPLLLLFVALLSVGFSEVGSTVKDQYLVNPTRAFFAWALGASLFAHTTTAIAVSYFDQSFAFIYLILAAIATLRTCRMLSENTAAESDPEVTIHTPDRI
jgi:hypothetical protein